MNDNEYDTMIYNLYNRLLDYQCDNLALELLEQAENAMSINGWGITDEWIEKLYRHALQQKPTTQEIQTLKSFLTQAGPDGPVQAAQALLAGNSFAWVD